MPKLPIHHVCNLGLQELVTKGSVDCLISDSEDGFSQLGQVRAFLSEELGYPDTSLKRWTEIGYSDRLEPSIGQLADWCRDRTPEITLVVIPSRRVNSQLKGLILLPYDGAESYLKFANGEWARPYRDFIYAVTWQALFQACHRLCSRNPALTHLSRVKTWRNEYKWESTYCQVEASLNFQDESVGLNSITFWDPCPGNPVANAIRYFHNGSNRSRHRPITCYSTEEWGIHFVTINW